ncbi:hypothetical protein PG993_012618 [Apiospora rasikravindrae]|uniref:Cytochrome P450 n=1 Tax=Apiospora rasikravindrae TaxID=990691 RepID=A0ABR1S2W7_9PEZI
MSLILLALPGYLPLTLILLAVLVAIRRQTRPDSFQKDPAAFKPVPVLRHIPALGHLLYYARDGSSYYSRLCLSTKLPIFAVWTGTAKVTLIQPELAKYLPKLKNVGLNPLALDMFRKSLGFGKFSSALLQEEDEASRELGHSASRMFREEFIPGQRLRHYAEKVDGYIQSDLRIVRARLAQLSSPQGQSQQGRGAQKPEQDKKKGDGFLDRIRRLCQNHGATPDGWTDYQLLLIAGLGPNIMSATTWLVYHILNDEQLLESIRREIDQLGKDEDNVAIDLSEIAETFPLLHATWLEVLRFHGTFLAGRYVREDTTLADTYFLPKGSYALAPLTPHHYDRTIWGDDADVFRPERFLAKDGKFDPEVKKRLRVFGLFGTICPGRFLATNMAMTLAIRLFSTLDMRPREGDEFVMPKERKDTVVGMMTPDREVIMRVTRRESTKSISMTWKS